jgi:hypothetical protein
MFALRVSLDNLRPWEWWAADAAECDLVLTLQGVYRSELADERGRINRGKE